MRAPMAFLVEPRHERTVTVAARPVGRLLLKSELRVPLRRANHHAPSCCCR